jgi:hypothetical protein
MRVCDAAAVSATVAATNTTPRSIIDEPGQTIPEHSRLPGSPEQRHPEV